MSLLGEAVGGFGVTKRDVKDLCEADYRLQWWAMVLFAEIVEIASVSSQHRDDDLVVASYVRAKADEFPRLVVQRQLEEARDKLGADHERKDAGS